VFPISNMNSKITVPLINVSNSNPVPAFDPMPQIPADSSNDFADLVSLSNASFYASALAVLNNTAFRRALPNAFGTPIQLSAFPYSAFADVNQSNLSLTLGADWLGKSGTGAVDFSFAGVNTPSNCSTQNQRGVYGLSLVYTPVNGTVNIQASPLTFGMQNDFAHLQNVQVSMCGTMSFNPATQNFQNTGDGWYYDAYPGVGGVLSDGHSFNVNLVHPAYNAGSFWGQIVVNAGEAITSCGAADLTAAGACELAFKYTLHSCCTTTCTTTSPAAIAGCITACEAAGGRGQCGPTANLAGLAAFQASFSGATAAFNAAIKNLNIDVTPGDVYDASSVLGSLNTMCQVASPVLTTINTIITNYKAAKLASAKASEAQGSLCGEFLSQTFDSSCICISGTSIAGCWIEKVLLSAYSSSSIQTASYNTKMGISDTLKDAKTSGLNVVTSYNKIATSVSYPEAGFFTQTDWENENTYQPVDAKFISLERQSSSLTPDEENFVTAVKNYNEKVGEYNSAKNLDTVLTDPKSKVDWLDESSSVINGLCTYPYMVLGAMQILGSTGGNKPAYVGIGISGSGSSSWLSTFETIFGSTVQKGDVDCANAFNFDPSQRTFAWNNFDLVSLRGFEGMNGQCYAAKNIQTYVPSGGLNPGSQTATFYISSKLQ
jgi:hypothetical protein